MGGTLYRAIVVRMGVLRVYDSTSMYIRGLDGNITSTFITTYCYSYSTIILTIINILTRFWYCDDGRDYDYDYVS